MTGTSAPDPVRQAQQWLAGHGVPLPEPPQLSQVPDDAPDDATDADADPESVARTIVLRRLATQARTRAELEKSLQAKQVPPEAARAVLDRMEAVGLVDDQGLAHDWVESRQQRRHLSRSALRRELTAKGVDREQIDEALSAVQGEDELSAARALVARKVPAMRDLDRQVRYRRLAGMLGRRGFNGSVVAQVVGELVDQQPPPG